MQELRSSGLASKPSLSFFRLDPQGLRDWSLVPQSTMNLSLDVPRCHFSPNPWLSLNLQLTCLVPQSTTTPQLSCPLLTHHQETSADNLKLCLLVVVPWSIIVSAVIPPLTADLFPTSKADLYCIAWSHNPKQTGSGFPVPIIQGMDSLSHWPKQTCIGELVPFIRGRLVIDPSFPVPKAVLY